VKERPVDLIILDMIMDPGIDGLDTFKQILKINPGQRAVIASGFSETERVKEAKQLGVGRYLRKPYTLENIAVVVREELDKQPKEESRINE
jgi:YesN/AraC family two-component response regulator